MGKGDVDYMALLDKAVGGAHDDGWVSRAEPNTGEPIAPGMFRMSREFAEDYARVMDERRAAE